MSKTPVISKTQNSDPLPDVSLQTKAEQKGTLHWVGMKEVQALVQWVSNHGEELKLSALVDAGVSLDQSEARGIHMSRLYNSTHEHLGQSPLNFETLKMIAKDFASTHKDLSQRASIKVRFQLPLKRDSLVSGLSGQRNYPVELSMSWSQDLGFEAGLVLTVTYSSTCPASAALSRDISSKAFLAKFAGLPLTPEIVSTWLESREGQPATPHAQRSSAQIQLFGRDFSKDQFHGKSLEDWIVLVENVLATPVQTFVKRSDEQAFAQLNAQNLMFCEDAGRRVQSELIKISGLKFWGEFRHMESLHPHDAVSEIRNF